MKNLDKVYIIYNSSYYEAKIVGTGEDPMGYSNFDYIKYSTRMGTLNAHKHLRNFNVFESKIDAICYMVTHPIIEGFYVHYRRKPFTEERMYAICRKHHPELLI